MRIQDHIFEVPCKCWYMKFEFPLLVILFLIRCVVPCAPFFRGTYLVQTNLSVQTNYGGEVGGGICKSVIRHTFANPPSHLSPAVGLHDLHGEVGLHLIHCLFLVLSLLHWLETNIFSCSCKSYNSYLKAVRGSSARLQVIMPKRKQSCRFGSIDLKNDEGGIEMCCLIRTWAQHCH